MEVIAYPFLNAPNPNKELVSGLEAVSGLGRVSGLGHISGLGHRVVEHCRPLLEMAPDAGLAKPHVDALVEVLAEITGISADDDLGETLGMNLPSGVALSPVQAAKCLKELMRTHTFIHAVAAALRDQRQRRDHVEVLYAGTGPYGLLLLPVLACLDDACIHATLIDVHEDNVRAVEKVIASLGIQRNIRVVVLADATCWEPPSDQRFDIIVSETMNWMLKNEPQVMIYGHLVPYLRDQYSTLIPQEIILDACLYDARRYHDYRMGSGCAPTETKLGEFARLNRESAQLIAAGDRSVLNGVIHIPDAYPEEHDTLKFRTEIQVYNTLWLKEGQCSLNTPLCFDQRYFQNGDSITLTYEYGNRVDAVPGYAIEFPKKESPMEEPFATEELGSVGIRHLKRLWHKARLESEGRLSPEIRKAEWETDRKLMDLLNLGLEECITFLYQEAKKYAQFERWVLDRNEGYIPVERVHKINEALMGKPSAPDFPQSLNQKSRYLNQEQLAFWQEHGYLVVEDVLDRSQCQATVERIYQFLEKDPDREETWYTQHPSQKNIMVQLFDDPMLTRNRQSEKAFRVFADLWQMEQLRCSCDRVGFNPPETSSYTFPGTRLHWDIDFSQPLKFATQGLIYLTDVAEDQGAFRCVPGFHHHLEAWRSALPPGADPNQQDLSHLAVKYVAAPAGSLIVWHQFLPHGSSPNRAKIPRIVQYLNMLPLMN